MVARIIHLGASSARKPSTVSLRHERRPHSGTPRRRSTRFDGDGRNDILVHRATDHAGSCAYRCHELNRFGYELAHRDRWRTTVANGHQDLQEFL